MYVEILSNALVPFMRRYFPDGCRFQQDNDPKHTSKYTNAFFECAGITYWKTPAESPDLNPIEMVWHELKNNLRRNIKPKNKEELINGINAFWKSFNRERCSKYIDHIQKVLPIILNNGGHPSGH